MASVILSRFKRVDSMKGRKSPMNCKIRVTQVTSLGSLNWLSIELNPILDKLLKLRELEPELEDLVDTVSCSFTSF